MNRTASDRSSWAYGAATLLALIGAALVLVARGGVYYSQWAPDLFIPLEGVLHLRAGQLPHRDFVTPVGSLWYVINAVPTLFMPVSAQVVVWADLIVALVTALAALIVCKGKVPAWLAAVCAFYVGMVALSPRQIGESFQHISNNASYNRDCWSLICAIALAAMLPARDRRREVVDGAIAGVLIAACFYIKITYAAAGVGFVGLALFTTRGPAGWRFAVSAGVVATGTVIVAGLLTGDLPGYFADMKTAVAVLPDPSRWRQLLILLVFALPGFFLVGVLARFANAGPGRLQGAFGLGAIAGLLTAVAGFAIQVQNHPETENPLVPIAVLVGCIAARAYAHGPLRISQTLGHRLIGLIFALMMLGDLGAIGWTAIAPVDTSAATDWLQTTQMRDLRVSVKDTGPLPEGDVPKTNNAILVRWREATDMLRRHMHDRKDVTVLPFIWSNPFPALLGLPPVRHEAAWWDSERTFNAVHKPDPHALLDGVDFVLIAHAYVNGPTTDMMWANYHGVLASDFKVIEHSPHWDLYARQSCARRALC